MKNVYYNETKLGSIITNRILSAEEILYLIDVDMDKYAAAHGWNGWDIRYLYHTDGILPLPYRDTKEAIKRLLLTGTAYRKLSITDFWPDATAVLIWRHVISILLFLLIGQRPKEFDKPKLNVIHGSTAEETFTSMVQEWIYDQENSEEIEWVDEPIYDEDVDCWYQTLKDNESEFDVGVEVDGVNIRVIS